MNCGISWAGLKNITTFNDEIYKEVYIMFIYV